MKQMKKIFATVLTVIVGGSCCLCGNAVAVREETYRDDGIAPLAASSISIEYENRSENAFKMALSHPDYTSSPYLGACACVAGANVIGFYDRYDENLIPNHKSGTLLAGKYFYSIEDSAVTEVVKQLYIDMDTDSAGTTVTEFKNGMKTFCNRKGKSISISSCMKNGQFDYSAAQNYMKANQPVVIFCSGYNVADFYDKGTYERIDYFESSANHVMVEIGRAHV